MTSSPLVGVDDDLILAPSPVVRRWSAARSVLTAVRSVPGDVVDGHWSAPPSAVEGDALDVVEVHRDVRDVAEEAHAPAVGRHVEGLGDVGSVEGQRSLPAWPSTTSLPSPGSQVKRSSSAPMNAVSLPWLPSIASSSVAAEQDVVARLPSSVSSPVPPSA
jgi:hypothetical protein